MKQINNNIEEKRVGFEVAKLLKEVGCKILPINTSPTDYVWGFDYDIEDDEDILEEREFQWEDSVCSHLYLRPTQQLAIDWIRVNFDINIEANWLPNIQKYRWLAKPKSIIPKNFATRKEFDMAVDKFYGKENFNTPEEAKESAIEYCLTNLILKNNVE